MALVILLVLVALVASHIGKGKVESRLAIANKEKEMLGSLHSLLSQFPHYIDIDT